jgi:hypothetical protein
VDGLRVDGVLSGASSASGTEHSGVSRGDSGVSGAENSNARKSKNGNANNASGNSDPSRMSNVGSNVSGSGSDGFSSFLRDGGSSASGVGGSSGVGAVGQTTNIIQSDQNRRRSSSLNSKASEVSQHPLHRTNQNRTQRKTIQIYNKEIPAHLSSYRSELHLGAHSNQVKKHTKSLVQNVILMGPLLECGTFKSQKQWNLFRKEVVCGKFCVAYSSTDWVADEFRAWQWCDSVAGRDGVSIPGIANVDVTPLVKDSRDYSKLTPLILQKILEEEFSNNA